MIVVNERIRKDHKSKNEDEMDVYFLKYDGSSTIWRHHHVKNKGI